MGKFLEKIGRGIIFVGDKICDGIIKMRKGYVLFKYKCWEGFQMVICPNGCLTCRYMKKTVYADRVVCRCQVYNVILMTTLDNCHFHEKRKK